VPRYKTPSFQKTYDAMLEAARDLSSRQASRIVALPTGRQFWDGYGGLTKTANMIPGTLSAVCFAAGKAFAKTNPCIAVEDAVWTPGVTRQDSSKV